MGFEKFLLKIFSSFFTYLILSFVQCNLCAEESLTTEGVSAHEQMDDVFSSTSRLQDIISNEQEILETLETFTEYTIDKMSMIKGYIESQKMLLLNGKSNNQIAGHPIDAYLLVRRLTADWEEIHGALHAISNYSTGVYTWTESYRESCRFPKSDDLNGAATAIVRLQDSYRLNMSFLSQGTIKTDSQLNNKGTNKLSVRDMLFFGKHAFSQGLYNRAIQWLKEAENAAYLEEDATALLNEIVPSLRSAIETHDNVLERQGPRGLTWTTNPVPIDPVLAKNTKYDARKRQNEFFIPKLFRRQTEEEEADHYFRLCRGEILRPLSLDANLKCRLSAPSLPLLLSPLKVEEVSHDPYILLFHDFVSEEDTDKLIEIGRPKLFRSRHRHHKDSGMDIVSQKRISQNAWIKDEEDKVVQKLTKKIQFATGLKASQPKEAEDYQIANYGLSGLYVPHTDHLMNNPDKSVYSPWERFVGDRIATLMIYLSDVDAGGATVFPRAGVTLKPKKGTAAFWWNLDRSGTGDENTRHGACPVLFGNKWVSNKWIRLHEQFQTAPCGLRMLDKFKSP